MAGRAFLRRYSPKEWGIRLALAAAAGWLGYLSVLHSWAAALPDSQIERAYSLAPGNGRIAARLSEVLFGDEEDPANRVRATRLAQSALRQDPTAVAAVATLGLDAVLRDDQAAAEALFTYSQRLSRRDLRTQLWAIQEAVARENVHDALRHYDIALRTKANASELLYPVLAAALPDRNIRVELVKRLATRPLWADSFIHYAARNGPDPRITAALFRGLQDARVPVPEAASNTLVNTLLAAEDFAEAWSYYSAFRAGATRQMSRDPDFKAMLDTPVAFDWVARNAVGISTVIQPGATNGVFDFSVSPSAGGVLLQQMQMLPEGTYAFEGQSMGIDQPAGSRPYWLLSCLKGRVELGRLDVPNSSQAAGRFTGRFTVPAECPVQVLTFVARSSNAVGGVTGQIGRAHLRPVR
jgi:hypothetical protein